MIRCLSATKPQRAPRVFLAVMAMSLLLASCKFEELGRELIQMEKFSTISGAVVQDTPSDRPVAVALFADSMKLENLVDVQLIASREFRFTAPPGRYFIFAFEDGNQDFRYQRQEPAGYFGDPSPIVLETGSSRSDISISLRRNLPLPNGNGRIEKREDSTLPKLWRGRKNIGAIASLNDTRFDDERARMGLWEPLRYSFEVGPGLYMLEPYDPKKIPVLFVHGIEGSPRAWRPIVEKLDRARFQPWFLSYASGLPIEANARYMFGAISQLRLLHGFDSLYIVAHSMGGLVSQAFIDSYRAGRGKYLKLFVTISTPWGGHDAAQLGVDYAPAVVPVWRDMVPGSAFLAGTEKNDNFVGLPYHLLFSYRGGGLPSRTANDGSVTVASQLNPSAQSRADKIHGFDAGHVEILSDVRAIELLNTILERAPGPADRQ